MHVTQFFGYGSLVNRATHDYVAARPARLEGWRRVWVHTWLRPVAYLSVERAARAEIEGLVAEVPPDGWAALDARERAYDKHPITAHLHLELERLETDAVVYAVPSSHAAPPDTRHPVLLSYVDVVVQGFLHVFGEAGADRFFATTVGWDTAILNDRADPRYSRHQRLSDEERDFVDSRLAALSATVVE